MTPDRIPDTGVKVDAQAVLTSSDVPVGAAMNWISLHAIPLSRAGRVAPVRADILHATYRILHPGGEIAEVRIPKTERGTLSGYFDHPIKLIHAIAAWNGKHSIYVTLNRVNHEIRARAWNRLAPFSSTTSTGDDVVRRLWFGVDVDPRRPRGIPATDAECLAALSRRDELVQFLESDGGFPLPLRTMSGNGGWALWRVDLPNSPENTALFRQTLRALSARFTDNAISIDTSVFQPAQLIKLCGTVAVTGDAIPTRPHRYATISSPIPLHLLERPSLATVDHLRWLVDQSLLSNPTYSLPRTALTQPINMLELFKAKGLYRRALDSD
jgi:hypothetical protein